MDETFVIVIGRRILQFGFIYSIYGIFVVIMVADDMEKRDAQFRKRFHISVVHAHLVVNQITQYQGEIAFRSIRSHQLPHIGNTFFPEIADLFVILDLRVADGQHHPRFRTIQFLKREIARLRRFERTERPEKIGESPDSFNGAI